MKVASSLASRKKKRNQRRRPRNDFRFRTLLSFHDAAGHSDVIKVSNSGGKNDQS